MAVTRTAVLAMVIDPKNGSPKMCMIVIAVIIDVLHTCICITN